MTDFSEYLNALSEDDWEEEPVNLQTFLYDDKFMGIPPLSAIQFDIVRRGSQIYKEHTLVKVYGEEKGRKFWAENAKELILAVGKGSGKDYMSQLICCYIVYQLLCLKNPAGYYGKPEGDSIDIVNVAREARQANSVFFSGLKTRIKHCPWFAGRFKDRNSDIEFDKNIRIHSLNSESEGTEGLNILVAVLDEIDSFDEGEEFPKANKMYKTLSATVSSRFDDVGKVLLLSFTRTKGGFMMSHYNDAIAEKNTIIKHHKFILNENLPEDYDGNSFEIEWEEDHIISYKFANVFAIRGATWEVNPTKTIDTFKRDFHRDMDDALGRFACCPTDYNDGGWFKNKEKIDACFSEPNGLDTPTGNPELLLKPDKSKEYYIHVDLARVLDNCAVAMAHVDSFKRAPFDDDDDVTPFVVVDMVRYWKPDRNRPIDFADVRSFIFFLKRVGFNIQKVTFDRWNSDQMIKDLNDVDIEAEKLSVGPDHYTHFALLMNQSFVKGPDVDLLRRELKRLVVLPNGKVDHLNKESKDLSDAVCGAIFNAAMLTDRDDKEVEVMDYSDIIKERRAEIAQKQSKNAIKPPPRAIPDDLAMFLDQFTIL